MENAFLYLLTVLAAIGIVLSVVILIKLKNVAYLLEQPVVKKMSPQLRLKPVRIDDGEGDPSRRNARQGAPARGRGQDRNEAPAGGRDSAPRERQGRPDREKAEGGERPPRADRDRNRDRDRDRSSRGDHRNRTSRQEVHSNGRDAAAPSGREAAAIDQDTGRERVRESVRDQVREHVRESGQTLVSAPFEQPALVEHNSNDNIPPAGLAPRRRLPSSVHEDEQSHSAEAKPAAEENHAHLFVGADDGEIQHGRRNQLKKKPRFDLDTPEAAEKTREETKA